MTLYSKEAKRKSEEKFATEWIHENVSHYEGENGSISIEEFFKLSPHERSKGKYKGVFKKDLPKFEPVGKLEEKEEQEIREEIWRLSKECLSMQHFTNEIKRFYDIKRAVRTTKMHS